MDQHEITARVRIDAAPGGKRFQGVWLEQSHGKHVIAYRPHELWRAFEGVEVSALGHYYTPRGQAIMASHFHVDTMRPLDKRDAKRFLAVHAPRYARGRVIVAEAAAGSKLALSSLQQFVEDEGGASYIAGSDETELQVGAAVRVVLRDVDISLSWAATPGGPHVWMLDVVGDDRATLPCGCPDPDQKRTPTSGP